MTRALPPFWCSSPPCPRRPSTDRFRDRTIAGVLISGAPAAPPFRHDGGETFVASATSASGTRSVSSTAGRPAPSRRVVSVDGAATVTTRHRRAGPWLLAREARGYLGAGVEHRGHRRPGASRSGRAAGHSAFSTVFPTRMRRRTGNAREVGCQSGGRDLPPSAGIGRRRPLYPSRNAPWKRRSPR